MSDPLSSLRDALAASPRDEEYLDFDHSNWTNTDVDAAIDLLLDAARRGDQRVPRILPSVCGDERATGILNELLTSASDSSVRALAAFTLLQQIGLKTAGLFDDVVSGRTTSYSLSIILDLWLQTGHESMVKNALVKTDRPDVRKACAVALWAHHGLNMYATVRWKGLGLIYSYMCVPLDSFQAEKLSDFVAVLGLHPASNGYAPCHDPLSPALRAAMGALRQRSGTVNAQLVGQLTDDEIRALTVSAAEEGLRNNPLGVRYVANLAGTKHRDLLEWAAALPYPDMAQAGQEGLQSIDSATP